MLQRGVESRLEFYDLGCVLLLECRDSPLRLEPRRRYFLCRRLLRAPVLGAVGCVSIMVIPELLLGILGPRLPGGRLWLGLRLRLLA